MSAPDLSALVMNAMTATMVPMVTTHHLTYFYSDYPTSANVAFAHFSSAHNFAHLCCVDMSHSRCTLPNAPLLTQERRLDALENAIVTRNAKGLRDSSRRLNRNPGSPRASSPQGRNSGTHIPASPQPPTPLVYNYSTGAVAPFAPSSPILVHPAAPLGLTNSPDVKAMSAVFSLRARRASTSMDQVEQVEQAGSDEEIAMATITPSPMPRRSSHSPPPAIQRTGTATSTTAATPRNIDLAPIANHVKGARISAPRSIPPLPMKAPNTVNGNSANGK
jgi:hypothetical protein